MTTERSAIEIHAAIMTACLTWTAEHERGDVATESTMATHWPAGGEDPVTAWTFRVRVGTCSCSHMVTEHAFSMYNGPVADLVPNILEDCMERILKAAREVGGV